MNVKRKIKEKLVDYFEAQAILADPLAQQVTRNAAYESVRNCVDEIRSLLVIKDAMEAVEDKEPLVVTKKAPKAAPKSKK